MTNLPWEQAIIKEFDHAHSARNAGKEGMARVCARRAAGIAIGEYLAKNELADLGPSAMDRLKYLHAISGVSDRVKRAAELLTLRVDVHHDLPVEADLILEAQILITSLFPDFAYSQE